MSIPSSAQSKTVPSRAPSTAKQSAGLGRLIAAWYGGLIAAAFLIHGALAYAEFTVPAAALLAAAVVIPISLLGYTLRTHRTALNSHILVPAIGPVVIAVLIFEFVEFNRRVDDAYSTRLVPADMVQLSDVKWSGPAGTRGGLLSGRILNRSPHRLVGISLQVGLYAGSRELGSTATNTELDVAPGQQKRFQTATAPRPAASGDFPCVDGRTLATPAGRSGVARARIECVYELTGTRGVEELF